MNFSIEGKPKIEEFLNLLKIFCNPTMICDDEKIQLLEMADSHQFNQVNKNDTPAFFAQINNDFFTDYQTQVRENHLKFAETNCLNIKLQQDACLLNSQLNYVCCQIPINLIYKALKPVTSNIKQLKLSFSYLISEHEKNKEKQIQLHLIIGAHSDCGFFSIIKPIKILQPRILELPTLDYKLLSINHDNAKTILSQLKTHLLSLSCEPEVVQFDSIDQEQIEISVASLPHYNVTLLEEFNNQLKIRSIYSKTYQPIFQYSSKVKLDCSLYLKQYDQVALLYFVASEPNVLVCSRQQVKLNSYILQEIDQISSQIQQNFSLGQDTSNMIPYPEFNNSSNMFRTIMQPEPQLFVPPKITGSIHDAILEYMTKSSINKTIKTLPKQQQNFQN